MPTYDYKCPNCGSEREIVHSIKEDLIARCTECDFVMERMISGGSFIKPGIPGTEYKVRK